MNQIYTVLFFLLPIFGSAQLMYPGDANNDGVANHIDLLIIGVGWESLGNERLDPSQGWYAHEFLPWTFQTPETGVNGAYLDADGNGLIDTLDIDAIALNYEMEQDSAGPTPWEPPFSCFECPLPVLRIEFEEDILVAPDTAWANIVLDYNGIIFPPEFGSMALAFGLEYQVDSLVIDDSKTIILPEDTPDRMFVVATNQGATAFRTVAPFRAQLAVSHFKQNGFLATHPVARVGIIIEDIQRNDTLHAAFTIRFEEPVILINNKEQRIGVLLKTDTLQVVDFNSGASAPVKRPSWKLFPNPARQVVRLEVEGAETLRSVRIWDVQGKLVLEERSVRGRLDISGLPAGVYWVEVETDRGRSQKKLVVQ